MKLILSHILSLLLALSPIFSVADVCCYAEQNGQMKSLQVLSDKTVSMKNCHDDVKQMDQHNHSICQCDHHAASSLPSIPNSETLSLAGITHTSKYINTPHLSYVLDSLYRPPINT